MTIKLWHCHNTRSLRPLWALEEMALNYELVNLPFPPRFHQKEYKDINELGTVPYLVDGPAQLTESSAILLYLAEKYDKKSLLISKDHPEYGDFLNWLFHSDATLTFPLSIVLRYDQFETPERLQPQVAEDYRLWFHARLKRINHHLTTKQFLCANRFTIADIAITYALYLGELLGLTKDYQPQTLEYLQRMKLRPAFEKIKHIGQEQSKYEITEAKEGIS